MQNVTIIDRPRLLINKNVYQFCPEWLYRSHMFLYCLMCALVGEIYWKAQFMLGMWRREALFRITVCRPRAHQITEREKGSNHNGSANWMALWLLSRTMTRVFSWTGDDCCLPFYLLPSDPTFLRVARVAYTTYIPSQTTRSREQNFAKMFTARNSYCQQEKLVKRTVFINLLLLWIQNLLLSNIKLFNRSW